MNSRNQSPTELLEVQESFEKLIVDLNDGNQFLMFKCRKCDFISRNNMNSKHAHWKRCPAKFSFRYLSQNESAGGCVVLCTVCSKKLMAPNMFTLKTHWRSCSKMAYHPTTAMPYTFSSSYMIGNSRFNKNQTQSNAQVKIVHENTVSPKEIDAQRRSLMSRNGKMPIPGFRIKYVSNENESGPERYSECLVCKSLFRKPTNLTLKKHRTMCSYQLSNVIMSVSTQSIMSSQSPPQTSMPPHLLNTHQPMSFPMASQQMNPHPRSSNAMPLPSMFTMPQQMSSHHVSPRQMPSHTMVSQPNASRTFDLPVDSSMDGDGGGMTRFTINENMSSFASRSPIKMCFICNTTTSESFVSLYHEKSLHSNTKIYDFIWQFSNEQPSVRDSSAAAANSNWSLLCTECLDMINEYDFARVTAAKFEKYLRDKLSSTEFYFERQRINMRMPLESPTTIAQRERELQKEQQLQNQQQQQQEEVQRCSARSSSNEIDTTVRDSDERYADELDDAVHYLVELSDDENNEATTEYGIEKEPVETIELSDEEDT